MNLYFSIIFMKILLILIPWFLTLFLAWCFNNNVEVIDDCIIPEECTKNTAINDLQNTYLTAYGTEPFWDIEISWWIATFSSPMYETDVVEPITIRQEWNNYYFSWEELEWEFILKDCIDGWKWDMHYYTVWVAKIRDYYYEWCGDWIEWIKMSDEEYSQQREEFMSKFSWNIKSCEQNLEHRLKMVEENATNINYGWYDYVNIWESYKVNWYITYTLGNDYITKDTTCTFQSWDFTDWWEFWNWEIEYRWDWNIIWLVSDEEQECLDSLYQYEPEQMKWDSDTMITLSCYPKNFYWPEYITWYIYTTTYPDLWLKISTPAWANYLEEKNDLFSNKSEKPIFTRDWNIISYWVEFIEVFEKSENESLENIIKKQLKNWCSINKEIISYEDQTKITSSNPKTQIYEILDNWDPYVSNNCFDDILDDTRPIIWFFESPDKTKYYKLAFTDWCAPGPCSMFGEVEVF